MLCEKVLSDLSCLSVVFDRRFMLKSFDLVLEFVVFDESSFAVFK